MDVKEHVVDRRTTGVQRQGRAAKVVASVFKATGEELHRVGYANLKVEEVAERAGVNKTTIYRRWPSKALLVSETLDAQFQVRRELIDTGSIRSDFIVYLSSMVLPNNTEMGRGIMAALAGRTDPEVEAVAKKLHELEKDYRTKLIQRAIERGELARTVNAELLGDVCSAPILRRVLTFGETVDRKYIEAVVDVALAGAVVVAVRHDG